MNNYSIFGKRILRVRSKIINQKQENTVITHVSVPIVAADYLNHTYAFIQNYSQYEWWI